MREGVELYFSLDGSGIENMGLANGMEVPEQSFAGVLRNLVSQA